MAAETVELGTIYLVDLVGSTRLATSVGPVRWDEMREQFFGLLREAIDASGGREFKNTGDGLMVAFASASAAVGCTDRGQARRRAGRPSALTGGSRDPTCRRSSARPERTRRGRGWAGSSSRRRANAGQAARTGADQLWRRQGSAREHGSEDVGRRRRRRPGPPLPAWLRCANDHVVGDRSNHCVELLDERNCRSSVSTGGR